MSKNQEIKNALYQLSISENFDIENNDTKQQFLNIYNRIFSNENNVSNDSLTVIRMLSINEWNKYIKNGTLNGSITTNNVNVWHYPSNTNYQCYVPSALKNSDSFFRWIQIGYCTDTPATKSPIPTFSVSRAASILYTETPCYFNSIVESFQNNANGITPTQSNVKLFLATYSNWYGQHHYKGNEISCMNVNIEKNKNAYSTSLSVTPGYGSTWTCNVNIYATFRPAFQYKDNNKSTDIYK